MKKFVACVLVVVASCLLVLGCDRQVGNPVNPDLLDGSDGFSDFNPVDVDSQYTQDELDGMFADTIKEDNYSSLTISDYLAAEKMMITDFPDKALNLRGRTVISNTTSSPARFVGIITSFWPNGRMTTGSGYMVGSKHVLTAGHNVYFAQFGGYARAILFSPGLNRDVFPYGTSNVNASRTPRAWITSANKEADVSVLRLQHSLGYRTGWIYLEAWYSSDTSSRSCRMNGYDGDAFSYYGKPVQMTRSGTANVLQDWAFRATNRYAANFYAPAGSSGGLLWRVASGGIPVAIGVSTDGNAFGLSRSQGVRMTPALTDLVRAFKADYP
jgi:V8-like Glu-specific endopeptidase